MEKTQKPPEIQPLTMDPVYYGMAVVFAVLTTALPAGLGQSRFLPIVQALALTIFLAMPLRAGLWRRAAVVMAIWLVLALGITAAITLFAPDHMERTVAGGFELRSSLVAWVYGASSMPDTILAAPVARMIETAGVVLGALLSAGLVGSWFLMQTVNATGFETGILMRTIGGAAGVALSIPVWSVLRLAGLAGLVILLSQPLLRGRWSVPFYWETQRTLIVWSLVLLALGILLGIAVPPLWQSAIATLVE